jgi:hypothetical protein
MTEIAHNHPPRCCCQFEYRQGALVEAPCPLCPEHGELAQLAQPQPGECPICHSEIGKQHTDYCRFTGIVTALPILDLDQFRTQTSTPTTHARTELTTTPPAGVPTGQWLHYTGNPDRIEHRAIGGQWHNSQSCEMNICGATPADAEPTPTATPTPEACTSCTRDYDQTPGPNCHTPTAHDHPR